MASADASLLHVLATSPAHDAEWETAALVLEVVHAVDAWGDLGAAGAAAEAAAVAGAAADAVEARIAWAPLDSELTAAARRLCAGLRAQPPARLEILGAVTSMGAALCGMGRYEAAMRACEAVLREARLSGAEAAIALEAQNELARALPFAATIDAARRQFRIVRRLARELTLPRHDVSALIGLAACDYRSGALDRADRRVRRALRMARREGWHVEAARAWNVLGVVHNARGEPGQALRCMARSLVHVPASLRDRALGDLGVILMLVGYQRVAWETLTLVEAVGRDRLAGRVATMNLLRLAADLNEREEFERRRVALLGAERLPPVAMGALYCLIGEAYHCFGEPEQARGAYRSAIAFAAEHGTHQWAAKAEEGIAALAEPAAPPPSAPPELAATVSFIYRHVRRLRAELVDA